MRMLMMKENDGENISQFSKEIVMFNEYIFKK